MATDFKLSVEKLDATTYSTWKFKLEMLLIKECVWEVLTNHRPQNSPVAWIETDNNARATIYLSVQNDQLHVIRQCATTAEIWKSLQNYHERKSLSNEVSVMRSICSLRFNDGDHMQTHSGVMRDLFLKLENISEKVFDEKWDIAMLLSSLPKDFNNFITALAS